MITESAVLPDPGFDDRKSEMETDGVNMRKQGTVPRACCPLTRAYCPHSHIMLSDGTRVKYSVFAITKGHHDQPECSLREGSCRRPWLTDLRTYSRYGVCQSLASFRLLGSHLPGELSSFALLFPTH